jgi:nicotinamide-nucleotide amidase
MEIDQIKFKFQINWQIEKAVRLLRDKGLTLGFAESCTGGLLSSLVTELPGVSDVFIGSVVSYDNRIKQSMLKVTEEVLKTEGAVSGTVARQMAEGAQHALGVSLAVAITGIAGPTGGSVAKPVGTVFIAVCGLKAETGKSETKTFQYQFEGHRKEIQLQACEKAVQQLLEVIKIL